MKILIVKRDKLGDMIVTTPMLRLLRTALPDAQIHLLAAEYNLWVVDGNARCEQHELWRAQDWISRAQGGGRRP